MRAEENGGQNETFNSTDYQQLTKAHVRVVMGSAGGFKWQRFRVRAPAKSRPRRR